MSFRSGVCRLALLACGLAAGCSHQAAPQRPEFLAVLRFENLGSDPDADWMGRAFSEIITTELTGTRDLYAISSSHLHALDRTFGAQPVSAPGIAGERDLALASGATRIAYGDYFQRAGRLEARLTIENVQTRKTVRVISAAAGSEDVVTAATALARQILPGAKPYDTGNERALKLYVQGLETSFPADAVPLLEQSIAADPKYGPPYRLLAQIRFQIGDPPGAEELLRQGLARGHALGALEDARIEEQLAGFQHDRARQQRALAAEATLNPADPNVWEGLAETASARRDYTASAAAYRKAAGLLPDNPDLWNHLGYTAASAGDLNAAMEALRRYQALRPSDPNPLDSMGDVNLLLGRLREAETFYLGAYEKNRNFFGGGDLFKAAMARLMAGDTPGADALSQKWNAARTAAHDPMVAFRVAEWAWVTGRRQQALDSLTSLAAAKEKAASQDAVSREQASRAYAEMAIWNLLLGRRPEGAADAMKAAALRTPSSTLGAGIAQFLSQPPAPAAEWSARADRAFAGAPPGSAKDMVLAYALLLDGKFEGAQAPLQRVYDSGQSSQDDVGVLLAWAYLETGHVDEAAALLRLNPIPLATGVSPFSGFSFPRMYYLRGALAARQGNAQEARANYRLFLQLSGSTPLAWGEERKVKAVGL